MLPYNESLMGRHKEKTTDEAWDIYDTLILTPKPSYDGKALRCQYSHEAYKPQDLIDDPTIDEASCNITVHGTYVICKVNMLL